MRYLSILLLLSCNKATDEPTDDSSGTGLEGAITWYEHVEPLVQKSCASCHSADGVGGVDLTVAEVASTYALNMSYYVEAGVMPPPSADPSCQDYKGSEQHYLTEEERSLFSQWVDGGSRMGNPEDAPEPIDWSQTLTDADTTLPVPFAYTLDPDAEGNDYHCFILENPFETTRYITGFDVDVDNSAVVHHMVLSIDTGGDAGEYSDDTDLSDGWYCGDRIIETDWSLLHAWTPGQTPVVFSSGDGMKVEPGAQIVLQMHYFQPGDQETAVDQSQYKVRTAPEVERTVMMYPYGPTGFKIPAGDESHTETASLTNPYADLEVLGVFPHMHWLGSGYDAKITDEAGDDVACLARGEAYDFDHQATYMYREPVIWKYGDTVHTTCTWDNSATNPNQYNEPPEDIHYGEGTNEEMCFFLFYFALHEEAQL